MTRLAAVVFAALALGCGAREAPAPTLPPPRPAPPPPVAAERSDHWLDQEVALARSTTGTLLTQGLPAISLTLRELRLLGADELALPVPPQPSWQDGFPAEQKRSGPNDLLLVKLSEWLTQTRQGDERDVSVLVDRRMPFRMLMEVLYTSAQAGYSRFHLIVNGGAGPREIVIEAPDPAALEAPGLTLLVVDAGVSIKLSGGNVAPGCKSPGPGIAVARQRGQLDSPLLARCLADLTRAAPEIGAARLAANRLVPFSEIVETLDAVRAVPALEVVAFAVPI